jgi:hypothetical protein
MYRLLFVAWRMLMALRPSMIRRVPLQIWELLGPRGQH